MTLGFQVCDIDLRLPTSERCSMLLKLVDEHGVIVVKQQSLTPIELIRFADGVGEAAIYPQENYHHPEHPKIFVSANVPFEGRPMGVARTGGYWHIDTSFLPQPHIFTVLQPKVLPSRPRTTMFCDLAAACGRLSGNQMNLLRRADAVHSGRWRYKIRPENVGFDIHEILSEIDRVVPPVRHPAVVRHPVTEVESLYITSGFTIGLRDRGSDANLDDLLSDVIATIEDPNFVRELTWEAGDVILWDNRRVSHRAGRTIDQPSGDSQTEREEPTVMFRITTFDRRGGIIGPAVPNLSLKAA